MEPDFIFPSLTLDLERIVVAGHSFGGITSIESGLINKKVSGVIALDPWFLPVHKQVEEKKYK